MRFRATSVTSSETGPLLNDVTVRIEDWLNTALGDGRFGEGIEQFTIVVISVDDEKEENERWEHVHNKLGRYKSSFTSESVRYLSIAVPILPSCVISCKPEALLAEVCRRTIARLSVRTTRVAKEFEYERFASAVSAALNLYVDNVP